MQKIINIHSSVSIQFHYTQNMCVTESRLVYKGILEGYKEQENFKASVKKEELKDKKLRAKAYKREERELQKNIKKLCTLSGKKEKNRLEKEVYSQILFLEKEGVFSVISQNILNNIGKKKEKEFAQDIVENFKERYEKQNDKKVDRLLASIHAEKPFIENEIEIIAEVGVGKILSVLSGKVERNSFFTLFSKITDSDELYASLDGDLTDLLEDEDISTHHKDIIFTVFIELYCVEKKISAKKRKTVQSEIIAEKNMHEFDYIKNFLKTLKKEKDTIKELVRNTLPEDTDDLRERDSARQKKEEEMLNSVRNLLGEESAREAQKKMDEYAKTDYEKRQIAYFKYINEEIKPSLEMIKKREIKSVKEYVRKQQKVLEFSFSVMPALSKEQQQQKQKKIAEEFGIFYEYLDALALSEQQNSYLPIIDFLTDGGRTKSQREAMRNLHIFTEEDIAILKEVESKRLIFRDVLESQRLQYSEDTSSLNVILESSQYKALKEKDPECTDELLSFMQEKNILTDEGIIAICGKEDASYRPEYFMKAYNFLESELGGRKNKHVLNKLIEDVHETALPKYVIEKYGKVVSKSGKISENIYAFFSTPRLSNGLGDIIHSVSKVSTDIVEYSKETGKFSEKGIMGELKETYAFFSTIEKLIERKKEAIREIGKMLHAVVQESGNMKTSYTSEIQKILKELEENYTALQDDVRNRKVPSSIAAQRYVSQELKNFIDEATTDDEKESRLELVNAEIKKLAQQFSEENLQNLLADAKNALEKDTEEKTGGKYLYTLLTGLDTKRLEKRTISIAEKILFDLIAEKKGVSVESIVALQDLMNTENSYGEPYIIEGESTAYYPEKNQIELESHIFVEVKKFDIQSDVEMLQYSAETKDFYENLSKVFHELGHSMVAKKGLMRVRFSSILQSEFGNDYGEFTEKVDTVYGYEASEDNMEELLVEIGALLQFEPQVRANFIEKDSVIDAVFSAVSESQLQRIFSFESYDEVEKIMKKKHFSGDGRSNDDTNREAIEYFERESKKQEAEQEREEEKIEDASFYTEEKHQEKKEEFDKILYGDTGKYEKAMDNTLVGYIELLEDALSYVEGPARSVLKGIVKDSKQGRKILESYFGSRSKIKTEKRADTVISYAEKLKAQVVEYSHELSRFYVQPGSVLSRIWKNTSFLTGDNVVDITKQWWNYFLRRHARKNKERVGKVGAAMAQGIAPGLATDFTKQENSAQDEEMSEYKGSYELYDDGDLVNEIFSIGHEDSFKAYMTEMSERGLIDWARKDEDGNRVYAKKLNSYGSHIRFYENDFLFKDGEETALNHKFQKAFLDVYGEDDLFYSFYSTNKNAIGSKTDDAVSVAAVRGGQPQQMLEWLYKHKHGEFVNPNVYEGFIKLMIGDGTTDPANYIYYLIAGVSHGLLDIGAFNRFYGYTGNTFPPFNGLANYSKADADKAMKAVMTKSDGTEYNIWDGPPPIWGTWVHANIMTLPSTIARTFINLGQKGAGKFDHDNGGLLGSVGRADTAGQMLAQGSAGTLETKSTIYNQIIYGQVQHILGLSNTDTDDDDNNHFNFGILQKSIARQSGFFSATDAIISSRLDSGKSKFKATDDFLKDTPRSGGGYNEGLDTESYLNMGRAIYSNVYTEKFKELADTFLFAGNYDHDADGFKKRWEELRNDSYVRDVIFKGEAVPVLKTAGNIDQQYAIICNKIFNHFFLEHPDAKKNVLSVVKAAQDIYFGKGIVGIEGSENWGVDTGDIPESFKENYKKLHGVYP